MKKLLSVWMVVFTVMLGLASCSENDMPDGPPGGGGTVDPSTLPEAVIEGFNARYPGATDITWSVKNDYAVASFYWEDTRAASNASHHTAWFTMKGEWGMTEKEIPFAQLVSTAPHVYEAFSRSDYGQAASGWVPDKEVDVLQRGEGTEKLYVIEVSKREGGKETEVDLYYTETGVLVKEIIDAENDQDYDEYLPQKPSDKIDAWLKQEFSEYSVIEIESEHGRTEVEVMAKGRKHEVAFDASQEWLSTKTGLYRTDVNEPEWVPALVVEKWKAAGYVEENLDEIERYEVKKAEGKYIYFCFEMRNGRHEEDVYADETGIISRPSIDGEDGEVPVEGSIADFIAQRYPGAVILEKEYDEGYLEIDIRHDKVVKEVKFNGRNEWVKTTWEIGYNALPEPVKQTLSKEGFQQNEVDDIEVIETESELLYGVEVEKGAVEKTYLIDASGTIRKQY